MNIDYEVRPGMPALAEQYRLQGYCFPVGSVLPSMVSLARQKIDTLTDNPPMGLDHPWTLKSHLLFDWVYALTVHSAVLDAVEAVIGPDILMQAADLFVKPGNNSKHINWHQDANYWNLDPFEICTAWIALTDVYPENGCMRFLPGTHRHHKLEHEETFAEDSALTRGQELTLGINEDEAVPVILKAGQISLHHCLLAHASTANRTTNPRIGLAVRYMPAHSRQTEGPPMSAILVRGEDKYGHFILDTPPAGDLDQPAIESHARSMAPHAAANYATA
jgi:non-heme Fe2+,alpha-ketoglutarate-dependent halogenase